MIASQRSICMGIYFRRIASVAGVLTMLGWLAPADDARSAEPVNFARDVRPLLSKNCFRCHGPDQATLQAGLRLDSREGATKPLEGGLTAILPGKSNESELIKRVASTNADERMPPADGGRALTAGEIDLLRRWIDEGAEFKSHWAFATPQPIAPPQVARPEQARNAIDHFVLARLEREGLQSAPEADRNALIRRVSIDLVGLPPSLEEVDRFVADTDPAAYERLVDRLLASPAFGERWAAVWLDLARYADSAGYAQDPPRTIWRYRDWMIRALNANQPFNEFTRDQLAGDLLPSPSDDQLLATAFHRNTMTNSEGGTDDEEFRNVAVVDRVNTTMQVWMGLTMGCAQCHTHKYDPITQEEYFKVFAIFNQSEDADRMDESPLLEEISPEQLKQRAELQGQVAQLEKALAEKLTAIQVQENEGAFAARYVRIELPGKQVLLSLAELQAIAGGENLALKGKASQTSVDYDGRPELAIDGNTDGDYFKAKSTTHTATADNPWWEVDLGTPAALEQVVIWNRTDGGSGERLKNFRVVLFDDARRPLFVQTFAESPKPSVTINVPKSHAEFNDAQRAERAKYLKENSPEIVAAQKQIDDVKKQAAAIKGVTTPIMRELAADKRRKTQIQIRGNFLDRGAEVTAGVPAAFHPLPAGKEPNRLALAEWLFDERNPLTARVLVNRYWEQLFGIGLVETSEDFGIQGEFPSHPELLDCLALEFQRDGWDMKQLLRRIVTSATYRQSSKVSRELQERDPFNRLLARGPRFRLSAEVVRDQALAIGGLLSRKMFGPSVQPPRPNLGLASAFGGSTDWQTSPGEDKYRRGLYTSWRRTTPYPSMTTFDASSREVCTMRRIRTNTPLQALVTMNDPVYVEAAQALARRIVSEGGASPADRARYGFRLCLARAPSDAELQPLLRLYNQAFERFQADAAQATRMATEPLGPAPAEMNVAELAAWTVVGNTLLNLDEALARR